MSGPWSVPLVTLEFRDVSTREVLKVRHSYHVPRPLDGVRLTDGPFVLNGTVEGVVWGDEVVSVYIRQKP